MPDQAFRFNFPAARTDLFAYFCALYRRKRDEKRFPTFPKKKKKYIYIYIENAWMANWNLTLRKSERLAHIWHSKLLPGQGKYFAGPFLLHLNNLIASVGS